MISERSLLGSGKRTASQKVEKEKERTRTTG